MNRAGGIDHSAPAGVMGLEEKAGVRSFYRNLSRSDRWAALLLTLIPLVYYSVPSLLGHPPISGDNQIQNFPLRELSGQILAHGHLPQWNTLAFSGTPLLGGLNAGSLYPLTWFFVFLPGMVAWVINVAVCYVAAGLGLYVLARWLGMGPRASFLGAISYAFMGMMAVQLVHLAVIQGQGWMPWIILGMLMMTSKMRQLPEGSALHHVVFVARWPLSSLILFAAMTFLTGEPRAFADLELVGGITFVYCVFFGGPGASIRRRLLIAIALVIPMVWGLALSAMQTLPGMSFITLSQRSTLTTGFLGSGSLSIPKTVMLLIPDFFGGTGAHFHQPWYFADYNLPEVCGYIGLLGIAALFAAGGQLIGSTRRSAPRWLGLFVAMAPIALLFSWGQFTPFINVMVHIPLIDRTRLPSRNLAIFDFAGAVLLAWFVEQIIAGRRKQASLIGWRIWLTLSPLVLAGVLLLLGLTIPDQIEHALGANQNLFHQGRGLWAWFLADAVVVLFCLYVLTKGARREPRLRGRLLAGFVALDVAFFTVGCSAAFLTTGPAEASAPAAASAFGAAGRTAIVDPLILNYAQTTALGQPNMNVFTGLPSIQGYGSLIAQTYQDATSAHLQNNLDPCGLVNGQYASLQLGAIAVASYELAPETLPSDQESYQERVDQQFPLPDCPQMPSQVLRPNRPIYFGTLLNLSRITIQMSGTNHSLQAWQRLQISVIKANGSLQRVTQHSARTTVGWTITLPTAPSAAGFVIRNALVPLASTSSVNDATGHTYLLNGRFQNALDGKAWKLTGVDGGLEIFHLVRSPRPHVVLVGTGSQSRVVSSSTAITGTETDVIQATTQGTLIRSVEYLPGWKATLTSLKGAAPRNESVTQHGIIQQITVPEGEWNVVFSYQAPQLKLGAAITAASSLAFGGLVLFFLYWPMAQRKRRRADER